MLKCHKFAVNSHELLRNSFVEFSCIRDSRDHSIHQIWFHVHQYLQYIYINFLSIVQSNWKPCEEKSVLLIFASNIDINAVSPSSSMFPPKAPPIQLPVDDSAVVDYYNIISLVKWYYIYWPDLIFSIAKFGIYCSRNRNHRVARNIIDIPDYC